MSGVNWLDLLGWSEDELQDLRFVGYSYVKQAHFETALKFFEALIVLKPDSIYDLQTIGAIHLEMGAYQKALKYIDQALILDPTHEETLLNRTKSLLLLGYNSQGRTLAKRLMTAKDEKIKNNAEALLLAYK
jgi:tetratricopeptide (TPR) repeat protein